MNESQGYGLTGFSISEKIYESNSSVIYRGFKKKENNLPVVIKHFKPDNLTKKELEKINSEYRLLNQLKNPGIIMPDSLENIENNIFLIMEDFGGLSLHSYIKMHKLSMKKFLEIALKITDILTYLHDSNIIHRNIEPRNILIHEKKKEVKLIDFSLASQFRREKRNIVSADKTEGSLAYISPEQTGRMNRFVDYRTDFYSLGATFYEMLTGRPPFEFKDPMELVHAHIARLPARPSELNPEIPEVISDIIMKLMSKNPEERYQSERGIKNDLEKCLKMLNKDNSIKSFTIGEMDVSEIFQIPEKLYGREKEIQLLFEKYESVSKADAKPDIILFSGFPGIGKSSLINEIQKRLAVKNSYFIQGKYDQFRRSTPFNAIIGAFSDLINQFLSVNERALNEWKKKILRGIGDNGNVIMDVIPQLKLIIGEQPAVPQL
jgi:serine/threonine protein kinase